MYGYAAGADAEVAFATVREPQSVEEIVAESGGAHVSALTTLTEPGRR